MGSRVKLRAVSYSAVVAPVEGGCPPGVGVLREGAVNPPAPLLLYAYSVKLNYGPEYLEMGRELSMFQETSARIGGVEGRAIALVRCFKERIAAVHVLVLLDKELDVDGTIDVLGSEAEVGGLPVQEYARSLFSSQHAEAVFLYRLAFIEAQGLSDEEIYGIVELDPTYAQASEKVVSEVVSGDVSMIRGISLRFSSSGGTVIYQGPPSSFIRAITNVSPEELGRALSRTSEAFNAKGWTAQDLALQLMPYLDYVAELELVVVEGGLLGLYERALKSSRRTKKEMARIKASINDTIEFYFALRYTRYYGAARAAAAASRAMGIDQMRSAFDERMRVLSDSIDMGHQLVLENWNKLLTYTIAGMSFASLTLAFIEGYYRRIFPLEVAAFVLAVTFAFMLVIVVLYERVTRRAALER